MKKLLIVAILLMTILPLLAQEPTTADTLTTDTLTTDTVATVQEQPRKLSLIRRVIRGFDRLDERYIEPQHYVFTAMVQALYNYDLYTLRSSNGGTQRISFAPDGILKAGPYFGWKWIFGGYAFSFGHSDFSKNKTEWDLSIYSSQIGLDLFYRRTGVDYKLRDADFGKGIDASALEDISFDGVKAGITGFNVYYIFNHGRFSYPAAFAQSTCQKISCGSWLAGVGYTRNSLDFDHQKLQALVSERLAPQQVKLDSGLMFNSLRYHDFSLSGGYAYNWVFAPQWLLCGSGQMAIGYKNSQGDRDAANSSGAGHLGNFSIDRFSATFIGRFAVVYNNMRWYAGFSAIVRSLNSREPRFSATNTYGNFNMYVGYNFGLKKKYRKKKDET